MTQSVRPDQQGQLQGAGASLMGVANLIGPALFTGAFSLGIRPAWGAPLPGAPYLVAAVLVASALTLAWRVTRRVADGASAGKA
jgi:DHA1 family tetracycline resistance protein-like MFS transporter